MTIARKIVDAIILEQNADELFALAMARSMKAQLEDFKVVAANHMFEAPEDVGGEFMPAKRNFSVEGINDKGEPFKYNDSAYGPTAIMKKARLNGHTVHTILDAVGNDVTAEAHDGLNESLRLVSKHGEGLHTGKVYKDAEWNEYRVKFFKDGKHVGEEGDYHTDDLDDAKDTCDSQLKRYDRLSEDTAIGTIAATIADQQVQKKQADLEATKAAEAKAAPTLKDVVSVLGNTVSVVDSKEGGQ